MTNMALPLTNTKMNTMVIVFWAMAIPVMILAGVSLVLGFVGTPYRTFPYARGACQRGFRSRRSLPCSWAHVALKPRAAQESVQPSAYDSGNFGRTAGHSRRLVRIRKKRSQPQGLSQPLSSCLEACLTSGGSWTFSTAKALDTFVYGGLTSLFTKNDRRIIDGGIDGICFFTEGSGRLFSFLQSGMLQYNLLLMVLIGRGCSSLFRDLVQP